MRVKELECATFDAYQYAYILRRMDGKDPKTTAWEMIDDENLPLSNCVRAYTMPDKFKMP
jgi:hypothetical protein